LKDTNFYCQNHQLFNENSTQIPHMVVQCVEYIKKNGATLEGIFRTSGSLEEVREIYNQFMKEESFDLNKYNVISISGALKHYLKTMKEPLLGYSMCEKFTETYNKEISSPEKCSEKMAELFKEIPVGNKSLLFYVFELLELIISNKQTTLMDENNLAVVFSPCMFKKKKRKFGGNGKQNQNESRCGSIHH